MKKIVVFGASGDTGRYLINYFKDRGLPEGYEIVASGTKQISYFDKLNVPYIPVDISRKEDFSKLPTDVYAVIDLAGLMPARMQGYDPQRYIDVNITGTLNILEYCRNNGADRMLFAQSFGDIKDYAEENIVLHPHMQRNFRFDTDHTIYVMTKNFAVDMMRNYREMYGLKDFVFRLPTIYLWSPVDQFYVDGVARKIGYRILIDKAKAGETIEIWGDKTRKKDMVYVKDFCQMLYNATFVDRKNGYYNVGSGIGTTLEDQIKGMVEVYGENGKQSKILERPDLPNAPQYIMDITAAVNELGYVPQYDYIAALKDMKQEEIKKTIV